jgi:ribosome-binding ATPase YchF (GTP1/OBG family)
VRAFEDEAIPHSEGPINPKRDIANLELELILSDLGIIEKRVERLAKDIKKIKNPENEKELELLGQCKSWLESEKPLRAMPLSEDQKRILRGFTFLSEKPVVHVLNLSDADAAKVDDVTSAYHLQDVRSPGQCGHHRRLRQDRSELVELSGEDALAFLADYGLKESGLDRLIRVPMSCWD